MTPRRFSAMFVCLAVTLGWAWRIAQDLGVPFWPRVFGGVLSAVCLNEWLARRIEAAERQDPQ